MAPRRTLTWWEYERRHKGPVLPPSSVSDLWDTQGHLRPEYHTDKVLRQLERRQVRAAELAAKFQDDSYKIPLGVRIALRQGFVYNQICKPRPWATYFILHGKRRRRLHAHLSDAVMFHKLLTVKKGIRNATIVSLARGYDIPPSLRGKLPPGWRWCPHCMKPRRYKRAYDNRGNPRTFYGMVKMWDEKKSQWKYSDRKLAVLYCPMCHNTNRSHVFRRSNQPWHTRKIKQGVRRIRKQRRR